MTGRPIWAEISLETLRSNFQLIHNHLAGAASVCAVVKANAYGHGAVKCARALQEAGAVWFGVTTAEEGSCLREAGITARILIMGGVYRPADAELALREELTPSIWEPFHLDWLESAASRSGRLPGSFPIHLDIDTGMSREGVQIGDLPALLNRFGGSSPLRIEAVYSHFASAEVLSGRQTERQLDLFRQAMSIVLERGFSPEFTHLANSSAVLSRPDSWDDTRNPRRPRALVRTGLSLYGYYLPFACCEPAPDHPVPLPVKPVMSWKTRITGIRNLPAGQAIGYGGNFVTQEPSRIASIPVGYADGLDRRLSSRGTMLVCGRRAPIVGHISMDISTLDVTSIEQAAVGDEVVMIGAQQGATVTAADLADALGSIPYEVLCNVRHRVPRIYVS